jgi:hypothetical protein
MTPLRILRSATLAAFCLTFAAGARFSRPPQQQEIVGRWQGTSNCVRGEWNRACHDETVLYVVRTSAAHRGQVTLVASKRVGGAWEWMGTLDFRYDAGRRAWTADYTGGRVPIRWTYRVNGREMAGTLVLLPSGRQARAVSAHRVG